MPKEYPVPTEQWMLKTMQKLGLTRQEAWEMWCDDHDIDAGKAKDFDLNAEQAKVAKAMMKGKAAPNYSLEGKKRKPREKNPEKLEIIEDVAGFITQHCEYAKNAEIVNPERQIDFHVGDNHYSITLTLHRPPKK